MSYVEALRCVLEVVLVVCSFRILAMLKPVVWASAHQGVTAVTPTKKEVTNRLLELSGGPADYMNAPDKLREQWVREAKGLSTRFYDCTASDWTYIMELLWNLERNDGEIPLAIEQLCRRLSCR